MLSTLARLAVHRREPPRPPLDPPPVQAFTVTIAATGDQVDEIELPETYVLLAHHRACAIRRTLILDGRSNAYLSWPYRDDAPLIKFGPRDTFAGLPGWDADTPHWHYNDWRENTADLGGACCLGLSPRPVTVAVGRVRVEVPDPIPRAFRWALDAYGGERLDETLLQAALTDARLLLAADECCPAFPSESETEAVLAAAARRVHDTVLGGPHGGARPGEAALYEAMLRTLAELAEA